MKVHPNLIDGTWIKSDAGTPNINPSNFSDIVGEYARADAGVVDVAVDAATAAQPDWAATTPQIRHDILEAVGAGIIARKDEIGCLLSREEGKTLSEGIGETVRAAQIFKFFAGGERIDGNGFFQRPAIFLEANNGMRVSREEIFGPCTAVIKVADYDEALAVANDTEFGLSAGICTTSLKAASHFRRNAKAGMVMVNLPTAGVDYHVPFGGRKGSSYGPREQGSYAREFYTVVKTSYVAP